MSKIVRFEIGLLATLLGLVPCTPAFAQTMTPTATQRSYNDQGVKSMFEGEFHEAAANFKSSLALGESNIAWLNYGRALFKLGRCSESRDAYSRAADSPAVAAPSRDEIATVLARFNADWEAACSASLILECPEELTVRLDDGEPASCSADAIPTTPGSHQVTVVQWDETFDVELGAEPVTLVLERSKAVENAELTDPSDAAMPDATSLAGDELVPVTASPSPTRVAGYALAAVGIATLATSLVLERVWVAPAFDAYEAAQTPDEWTTSRDRVRAAQRTNRIVFFSGLGLSAVGATLVVLSLGDEPVALRIGSEPSVTAEVRW